MIRDFLVSKRWKEKMHYSIKAQLSELLKRSRAHEEIYKSSSNPTAAQVWCAMAELATDIKFIELRLKRIEEALKEIRPKRQMSKSVEEL